MTFWACFSPRWGGGVGWWGWGVPYALSILDFVERLPYHLEKFPPDCNKIHSVTLPFISQFLICDSQKTELSSTYMELGIWMLEEYHVCTSIFHLMSCLCLDKLASCVNMKETETEYEWIFPSQQPTTKSFSLQNNAIRIRFFHFLRSCSDLVTQYLGLGLEFAAKSNPLTEIFCIIL